MGSGSCPYSCVTCRQIANLLICHVCLAICPKHAKQKMLSRWRGARDGQDMLPKALKPRSVPPSLPRAG